MEHASSDIERQIRPTPPSGAGPGLAVSDPGAVLGSPLGSNVAVTPVEFVHREGTGAGGAATNLIAAHWVPKLLKISQRPKW